MSTLPRNAVLTCAFRMDSRAQLVESSALSGAPKRDHHDHTDDRQPPEDRDVSAEEWPCPAWCTPEKDATPPCGLSVAGRSSQLDQVSGTHSRSHESLRGMPSEGVRRAPLMPIFLCHMANERASPGPHTSLSFCVSPACVA